MTDVSSKEDVVCSLDGNSTTSKSETLQNATNTVQASATASDLSTKVRASPTAGPAHGHGAVVATHYNTLQEKGLDERCKSRIFYLRNFNNWTKSMLINEFMSKLWQLRGRDSELRVMDMCCGKGGDLLKWRRGNISHLVCVDLAATSVEQCRNRYNDLVTRSGSERGFAPVFSAEFIAADCTKTQLKQRYQDSLMILDLVSCQFAFHYCFESLPQAECMLRNAAECLRPGGFFIGTMPDAYEIVHHLKTSGGKEFGNDLYKIEFQCDTERIPLFGAKYDFHLEGVVDCPEFLVHFPTLIKLAEKFGLRLVFKKKFSEYYKQQQEEGRSLLGKMQALETYPPFHESPLLGKIPDDYEHVEQYMQRCMERGHRRVGTLSRSEWEAAGERTLPSVHVVIADRPQALYLVFAFEKQKSAAGMDETQSSEGGSRRSEAEGRQARSDNAAATTL